MPTAELEAPEILSDERRAPALIIPTPEVLRERLLAPVTPRGEAKKPATEEQIEAAIWLVQLARQMRMTTWGAIASFTRIDVSIVSRWLRGEYTADLAGVTSKVQKFRHDWQAQQKFGEMPFIEHLSVVKKLTTFAAMLRATRQIGPVWGESQTGKTTALEFIQKDPTTDTIVVRLPANGTQMESFNALCEACGVGLRKSYNEKRQRVFARIQPHTLLIFDEFHQLFLGRTLKLGMIELIREIHDVRKCPIMPVGTKVYVDMLESEKFKDFLNQIRRRGVLRQFIPTAPEADDFRLIYSALHLPAPNGETKKLVEGIANTHGIGVLFQYFEIARMLATNDNAPLSWDHFLTTNATLAQGGKQ